MTILYLITSGDAGGAQRYVLTLAKKFGGTIAVGGNDTELLWQAKERAIPVHRLKYLRRAVNPWYDFWSLIETVALIRRTRPDIVHANSSKTGFIASLAAGLINTKLVYTAHGFVFNEPLSFWRKTLYKLAERLASRWRSYIIAVSDADRIAALKAKLIDRTKIQTVHNGIAPLDFLDKTAARAQLNLPVHNFIVGTIANAYPAKGLEIMVQAAAKTRLPGGVSACFVIIGTGPKTPELKELAEQLKLSRYIFFVPGFTNAATLLKAFDLFVLPSRKEGFPYVLLEAMQAGLPIIATDVGGNREALGDAGVLIPPQRPDLLARAIDSLVESPQRRQALGEAALIRAGKFTEKNMLEQTRAVYQKVLRSN